MAVADSYNIKQITGYDISTNPSIHYNISVPTREPSGEVKFTVEDVEYATAINGASIIKLGYCCEPKGAIYPIFLEVNGSYKQFQIGRDGMYEVQPEQWKNINETDPEDKETNIVITGVRVPKNINFTLDYVLAIN